MIGTLGILDPFSDCIYCHILFVLQYIGKFGRGIKVKNQSSSIPYATCNSPLIPDELGIISNSVIHLYKRMIYHKK